MGEGDNVAAEGVGLRLTEAEADEDRVWLVDAVLDSEPDVVSEALGEQLAVAEELEVALLVDDTLTVALRVGDTVVERVRVRDEVGDGDRQSPLLSATSMLSRPMLAVDNAAAMFATRSKVTDVAL